ncbi:hypothetical protein, partial [Elizabethkingia meningoseptica]
GQGSRGLGDVYKRQVGAESKYEIPPLFYRLSGTFRQANPQSEHCAIRINPNRSGEETVLRILRESIASI